MNSRFTDESLNWRTLCRAAVLEQDPDKLSQIVNRINLALGIRQRVLRSVAEATRAKNPHISSRPRRAA
jgi:hypothetical protein